MSSAGHRYRIRSPLNSPRRASPAGASSESNVDLPPPTTDTSDDADSDTDTVVDDSGREGSSTPNSRETSIPPRGTPHFAGLHDEAFENQALAQKIPYEIILNIFRYLDPLSMDYYNCLFVCKSWAKCAVENVWFRPSIKTISQYYKFGSYLRPSNPKIRPFFPYSQFVKRLNLTHVARELTPGYFLMLFNCTKLERITMGGAFQVSNMVIANMIPRFERLLALDLSHIDLEDDGLCAIAASCVELQGLNVSHCFRLTDISVMDVATNCHALRRVHSRMTLLT